MQKIHTIQWYRPYNLLPEILLFVNILHKNTADVHHWPIRLQYNIWWFWRAHSKCKAIYDCVCNIYVSIVYTQFEWRRSNNDFWATNWRVIIEFSINYRQWPFTFAVSKKNSILNCECTLYCVFRASTSPSSDNRDQRHCSRWFQAQWKIILFQNAYQPKWIVVRDMRISDHVTRMNKIAKSDRFLIRISQHFNCCL